MGKKEELFEEEVKVSLESGFVLYGTIIKKELHGIWLKTDQETSFINFNVIRDIRINRRK